eukprot:753776-Hanusia_phi.AAC.10
MRCQGWRWNDFCHHPRGRTVACESLPGSLFPHALTRKPQSYFMALNAALAHAEKMSFPVDLNDREAMTKIVST